MSKPDEHPPENSKRPKLDSFEVKIGDENLNFRTVEIDDPKPTGRQILKAAGAHPVEEFIASVLLPDGTLEDLRLDELYDLRDRGVEKVIVIRSDRSFRFLIDGKDQEWGKPMISGLALKRLVGVNPATHDVYQEVRGGDDILIRDTDLVDLSKPGVEKFFTAIAQTTEGLTALPPRDVAYLEGRGLKYQIVQEGAQRAVILHAFPLPAGKFDAAEVDVLIQLPPGYPDCAPDMFYCLPWLKLMPACTEPRATEARLQFCGQVWQRWSRHNNEWRPGVDGLHTMVKRVERAFEAA